MTTQDGALFEPLIAIADHDQSVAFNPTDVETSHFSGPLAIRISTKCTDEKKPPESGSLKSCVCSI